MGILKSHGSVDFERAVGADHIRGELRSPFQGVNGLRRIAGTGSAVSAAASDHNHSLSMKLLPRAARAGLLARRERLRSGRDRKLEARVADLEAMVLALCHLAFDDEDATAEERERLILEDRVPTGRRP